MRLEVAHPREDVAVLVVEGGAPSGMGLLKKKGRSRGGGRAAPHFAVLKKPSPSSWNCSARPAASKSRSTYSASSGRT